MGTRLTLNNGKIDIVEIAPPVERILDYAFDLAADNGELFTTPGNKIAWSCYLECALEGIQASAGVERFLTEELTRRWNQAGTMDAWMHDEFPSIFPK